MVVVPEDSMVIVPSEDIVATVSFVEEYATGSPFGFDNLGNAGSSP